MGPGSFLMFQGSGVADLLHLEIIYGIDMATESFEVMNISHQRQFLVLPLTQGMCWKRVGNIQTDEHFCCLFGKVVVGGWHYKLLSMYIVEHLLQLPQLLPWWVCARLQRGFLRAVEGAGVILCFSSPSCAPARSLWVEMVCPVTTHGSFWCLDVHTKPPQLQSSLSSGFLFLKFSHPVNILSALVLLL